VLVGVLFIGFAVTDGMDMGVGTLLPFLGKNDDERRVIINTVGPHWDGNQVWLITAGGAIFAAWPLVYATAFSGFYFAMLLALFALFFRPVGFDYRSKIADKRWRNAWDWGLFIGGAVPALVFGIAFGNLLQGVPFHLDDCCALLHRQLLRPAEPVRAAGGAHQPGMLTMHGAIWLQLRTEEPIASRAKQWAKVTGLATIGAFALAGLWLTFGIDGFRVVSMPPIDATPNPLTKEVVIDGRCLARELPRLPADPACSRSSASPGLGFAISLSMKDRAGLGLIMSGVGITGIIMTAGAAMFPFIMPSSTNPGSSLIAWDATSSHLTLTVMFWAAVIFIPLILFYTTWTYARMWRRVTVEEIKSQDTLAY
jgi:cytochrome d ubiquinol oxidase subunit II